MMGKPDKESIPTGSMYARPTTFERKTERSYSPWRHAFVLGWPLQDTALSTGALPSGMANVSESRTEPTRIYIL